MLLAATAFAQNRQARTRPANYPPKMPGAKVEVYKTVGDVKLNMYIYYPEGHQPAGKRPAIVFFFGGGWRSGTPSHFARQAEYFASRGMVTMAADYRVSSRHGAKIADCVEDAKSAIRWARANAARLGIDPDRIVASGGSAGGHLAAATGTLPGLDAASEDASISSRPNAMVLFNPATLMAPAAEGPQYSPERLAQSRERAGAEPEEVSPYHHVRKGAPPAIIFHGKADTTVPYNTAELFTKKMKQMGNRCELVGYDGAAHGFFNYRPDSSEAYVDTVRRADEFLASLGYLKGPPTVKGN
jgi:acetyl esterase/lipase